MKHVLMLGAGLVAGPIARYLLDLDDCRLTVASLDRDDARSLIDGHPRGDARSVNVARPEDLDPLIAGADLVISLVPYDYHVGVARLAIGHRVDMVTTSYVSPAMQALDGEARSAGVLILNECGLDPGLDHMSAMRTIRHIRDSGGTVTGFWSACGGLPSPEAADNPWRYKFSWSPRGALLAGLRSARYLEHGRVRHVPHDSLFSHHWSHEVGTLGTFEVYPNGDALRYVRIYGLDPVRGMFRGTFRYPGWCDTMQAVADLGLLDLETRSWPEGTTHAELMESYVRPGSEPLAERLARRLRLPPDHEVVRRLEWAGLLSNDPLPSTDCSPFDMVAACFAKALAYEDGERDMVVLEHRFTTTRPGHPAERIHSRMIVYGDPGGESATSRTVSLPAAVAARMMLAGGLELSGVRLPIEPRIYEPVLDELEALGIGFEEWRGLDER